MGMVLTQNLSDDHSAFAVRLVGSKSQLAHSVKYTPVYGLQTVAHVGNGAGYVDRHRIGYKGFFQLAVNLDILDGGVGDMLDVFVIFIISYVGHNNLLS